MRIVIVLGVAALASSGLIFSALAYHSTASQKMFTKTDIDRMMKELSNWGAGVKTISSAL